MKIFTLPNTLKDVKKIVNVLIVKVLKSVLGLHDNYCKIDFFGTS